MPELAVRFEFVNNSPDSLQEPVRLDRTNTAFHDLHRLARLFLTGDWQSTTTGRATGFTLLFPMNDLFEAFIGRSLQRALASRPIHLQHRERHALIGTNGEPLFSLRSDVVIGGSDDRPVVIDTKWKRLTPRARNCERTSGVVQSDIYQMLACARAYDAKRLVLIYPWHEDMVEQQGLSRRLTVTEADRHLNVTTRDHARAQRPRRAVTETNCRLDVVTVDVGRPDSVVEALRGIIRGWDS